MAQIHLKNLDPALFVKSGQLTQASCTVLIENTGGVHNLVEGDLWTIEIPSLGALIGEWAAFSPSQDYQFYFGTGATGSQIGIPIAAQTATQVAASICSAITALNHSYLIATVGVGGNFVLSAGPYFVGVNGNAVGVETNIGKVTNENGTALVGGADSGWTLANYFDKDTYGIVVDSGSFASNGIATTAASVATIFGILSDDLSFSSSNCSMPGWGALGFGVPGGASTAPGSIRPDIDLTDQPQVSNISLGDIKGFLVQTLGGGDLAALNPSNKDVNLHFVTFSETDISSTVTITYFFGVAYLGNQDVVMDTTPGSDAYPVFTTSYGPNGGATINVVSALNMLFDTIPASGGLSGLPVVADSLLLLADNPPTYTDDIGVEWWGNQVAANALTRGSDTNNGLYLSHDGLGGAAVQAGGGTDWFVMTGTLSDPNGMVLNLTFAVGAPESGQTLWDCGQWNGTTGARVWLDGSNFLWFAWGADSINTGNGLPTGLICSCTFIRVNGTDGTGKMHMFVNPMSQDSGQSEFGTTAGSLGGSSLAMSLLANNDGTDIANQPILLGACMYFPAAVDQFGISPYVTGSALYPSGVWLPGAIHSFWMNYLNSRGAYPNGYTGVPAPAPIIF